MATPNIPDGFDPVTRLPIQNRKYDLSQLPAGLVCPREGAALSRVGSDAATDVRCTQCGEQYGLSEV